jgi:peptidoglycan hydrolase CwlO-like protein
VIATLCLAVTLAAAQPVPPPLTEQQIEKVRTLVKTHQEEQTTLKAQLEKAQRKLAECYAKYELDDAEVKKLQAEVLDAQGKLLAGYHAMQKELRAIVGPERFAILSKRIENAIRNPPDPKKNPPEPKQ